MIAAPLAVGGVHVATTVALLVACLACAWWTLASRRGGQPRVADPLLAALTAVLIYQGLTLLPLPADLLTRLSPRLADLLDSGALPGDGGGRLSFAPGATAWEVLKLAGALAAVAAATTLARREGGGARLVLYVALAGTVALLISLAQTLTGTHHVLWFYRPQTTASLAVGTLFGLRTTFVNPNHAAQLFELCGLASLAAGVLGSSRWRIPLIVAGACLLTGALATGSRGGWFAVGAGALFLLTLWIAREWPGLRALRWAVPTIALGLGLIAGASIVHSGLRSQALDERWLVQEQLASKVRAWPAVVRMGAEHRWTGIGRGAFRDAYPQYQEVDTHRTRAFPENQYLQVLVELGLPAGLLLLMAVGSTWAVALGRWRDDAPLAGALTGTLAIGIHGFTDFGLEFAGVGLAFVVLLGVCAAGAWRGWGRAGAWLPWTAVGIATLSLLLSGVALRHGSIYSVRHDVATLDPAGDAGEARDRHLRWRPVSADLAISLAGHEESRRDFPAHMRWLSRAMVLAPGDPTPHMIAARSLSEVGKRGQALLEVRLAVQAWGERRDRMFGLLTQLAETPAEVEQALGHDPEALAEYAIHLVTEEQQLERAQAIVDALGGTEPRSRAVARAQAEVAMARGDSQDAEAVLRDALRDDPGNAELILVLGRCLLNTGDHEGARSVLRGALEDDPGNAWLLMELTRVEIDAGETRAARRLLRAASSSAPTSSLVLQQRLRVTEGMLATVEGDHLAARDAYLGALRLRPDASHVRLMLGDAYRELGQNRAALREYHRVERETGPRPGLDQRIEAMESGGGDAP